MRQKILRTTVKLLVVIFFALPAYSQVPVSKNAQNLLLWQQRVDTITDSILKDSFWINDLDRAVYLSLLAKTTWAMDNAQANSHLKKAFGIVLGAIANDDKIDFDKKLDRSQRIFEIANALDSKQAAEFSEKLRSAIEEKAISGKLTTESLVTVAIQLSNHNPKMAFSSASKSLVSGTSPRIYIVISKLNEKEPSLAQSLFSLSILAAKRRYNYEFVASLSFALSDVSETERRKYAELLSDVLNTAAGSESDHANCKIARIVAANFPLFDHFLPDRSQNIRQQADVCFPFFDVATSEIKAATDRGESIKTADDMIRAARNTRNRAAQFTYFKQAVLLLEKKKQFQDLIAILDDMNSDEIKVVGEDTWDDWRTNAAYQAAKASFSSDDFPTGYRIINRTPKRIRYDVRFRLAGAFPKPEFRSFVLENLEEARKELGSLEIPVNRSAKGFLTLSKLYLSIQPTEAESAFREAVKYINKTDSENEELLPEKDYAPRQEYVRLP
jgi:hypothetical protein